MPEIYFEHHHWILYIQIILGTKFQLKLTILMFWTKFAEKGCFPSKNKKLNTTIDFWIFELVLVLNISWNGQFWFFGSNLPKKGVSVWTRKSEHLHWILLIRISLGAKFQLKLSILIFWPNLPKKGVSRLKQKRWTLPLNSAYSN